MRRGRGPGPVGGAWDGTARSLADFGHRDYYWLLLLFSEDLQEYNPALN